MATATTTEFVKMANALDAPPFSLLEQKGLLARLGEEIARASREIARNPRGFIRELFADDTKDAKRRRKLYFGLAGALVAHVALLALVAFIGWHSLAASKEVDGPVIMLPNSPRGVEKPAEEPKADGSQGSHKGGGGRSAPTPPSIGQLPKHSLTPPLIALRPEPTPRPPALAVQETIPVDPRLEPPRVADLPIGDPKGLPGPPSPGPGTGGGIGTGTGGGIGSNDGPGSGRKGSGGTKGEIGPPGAPDGTAAPQGPIPFNRLKELGGSGIIWLHRPTPVTTPHAQAKKVNGEVLLRATFRADGTITDIEVIREVPFMTESAIESLRRSRFRPAMIKGQPVTLTNVVVRVNVTSNEH